MDSTQEIVTAISAHYGSDTKAAPHFDVSQVTFGRWRNGRDYPNEDAVILMAELLKLDPAYVLAIVRRDRAKSESAKKVWRRVAEQFKDAAVVAALAIGAASFGGFNNNVFAGSSTPASSSESGHKYTLRRYQRRRAVLGVAL